jgi:hypothetical protein
MDNADKKRKGRARDEIQTMVPAHINEGKSLVLLQVNCRSIYNKALELWKRSRRVWLSRTGIVMLRRGDIVDSLRGP